LQSLSLCSAGLDVIDAITIASALAVSTSLLQLSLSDNTLGAEGGSAISRALKQNNTLTHLNLSFCSLGCDANVDGWSNSSNNNSSSNSNSQYKGLQTPQHYHSQQQQGTPQSGNSNGDSQVLIYMQMFIDVTVVYTSIVLLLMWLVI
jgi:Leucine Rich repeat